MDSVTEILCIDDDPVTLALLEAKLGMVKGIRILTATDGVSGIKIATKRKPDIILIDWEMPKMSGLDVASELRSNPKTTWIPRFMLTGRSKMKDMERAAEHGIEGYFSKPINLDFILRRLNKFISK
jgi:CheY-like chemotaxis protein